MRKDDNDPTLTLFLKQKEKDRWTLYSDFPHLFFTMAGEWGAIGREFDDEPVMVPPGAAFTHLLNKGWVSCGKFDDRDL